MSSKDNCSRNLCLCSEQAIRETYVCVSNIGNKLQIFGSTIRNFITLIILIEPRKKNNPKTETYFPELELFASQPYFFTTYTSAETTTIIHSTHYLLASLYR